MTKRLKKQISIVSILFSVIILIFILNKIELYSDDFYYKSFLNGDLKNFINLNIEHYQKVNGRVIVHLLNEIMLNMNIYVYIVFIILCLLYDFYIVSKLILSQTKLYSKENMVYSISISMLLFLLIDIYVLKETAFWISGAFNYIFPITISIAAFSVIKSILDNNKINIFQIFLIFLASATTEQGFMATILFTIVFSIIHNIDKKIILDKKETLFLIIELLGFTTIFLSPASRLRADNTKTIFNTSIIELFEENFETLATRLVGENSIFIIISLLIISISLLAYREKKLSKVLLSGFLISGVIVYKNLFGESSERFEIIMTSTVIIYVIISIIELFKVRNYRMISLILTVAFLLQGGTFALGEISYRAIFILSLICLVCTANIFTIFINSVGESNARPLHIISVIFLIILATIHIIPIINGYAYNKSIFDDMRKSIEDYDINGYVEINLNIDTKYAHTMGYLNGDFYDYFMDNYGIVEKDVHFIKDDASQIFINGKRLKYPAIIEGENTFIPTRYAVEILEGNCEWTFDKTKYYVDDYYVILDNYSNKIIECSNSKNINIDLSSDMRIYMNRTYINIDELKNIIGENENEVKVGLDI